MIEGSDVQFAVELNREPGTAALELGASGEPSPRTIPLSIQGTKLTGTMPRVTTEQPYSIVARAADGRSSTRSTTGSRSSPIERPPCGSSGRRKSWRSSPRPRCRSRSRASDDFGVARLGIAARWATGRSNRSTCRITRTSLSRCGQWQRFTWKNTSSRIPMESRYYAFIEDNHPDRPHRVASELRFIDILPYKQTYQFVEGGGTCNGSSATLEELIARQRSVLNRTFVHEQDAPASAEVVRRLVKSQEEIATATDRLAERHCPERRADSGARGSVRRHELGRKPPLPKKSLPMPAPTSRPPWRL